MNHFSATRKARIEAQGFVDLDEGTLAQIDYWLRVSPAICMLWVGVGTALSSPMILWSLVPFAALGALLASHPFDVLYNLGFRYLTHGPRLPRYPLPRRFACLMATIMIAGTAWSFQSGHPLVGHILGWAIVAAAFANVSIGFCVPSFIYGMVFGMCHWNCSASDAAPMAELSARPSRWLPTIRMIAGRQHCGE